MYAFIYKQEAALKESNRSLRDQLSIFQNRCQELEQELKISRIAAESADKTTSDASADLQRLTETFETEKMQSDLTIKRLQVHFYELAYNNFQICSYHRSILLFISKP